MKTIIFLILFVNVNINTFAQNGSENMLKYWHYRNRLKYFVIPGNKQGESEIIGIRNRMDLQYQDFSPDSLRYYKNSDVGQHGVYFGYYLSMLATEYKLLIGNNQTNEASNTLHEIDLALLQFEAYMDSCEYYWGVTNKADGFFVRENMPCDFLNTDSANGYSTNGERHLDLFNKNLTKTNNVWNSTTNTFGVPAGHPGYSDFIDARMCTDGQTKKEPMSQDEAVGVLQGLALIKRCCPGSWAYSKSKEIACNIVSYIQNMYPLLPQQEMLPWQIYLPDGSTPGGGAGFAFANAYGFEQASDYFDYNCVGEYDPPSERIWELMWEYQGLHADNQIYNNSMSATLAAIGKSWHIGITIDIGCCWGWCSWFPCVHIPVYIPATGWCIDNVTSYYNSETWYLLLYEVLRNKSTDYLLQFKALAQINSAPCEGPYNYGNVYHPANDVSGGWSSSYRWRKTKQDQQGGGGFHGNYNGLDYMAFYNLYYIKYGGIPYENYNDRHLSGTVNTPQNFVAFNTITSTQVIDSTTTPIVNYKAGEQIELKPGFHAQEGSTFHAYIAPVCCGENFITDTVPQLPVDTLTPEVECVTDSLPAMPCGYDTLHFNGIDSDTARYSYVWSFPGGSPSSSTIKNPSVYYPTGTYQITLQATDTTQLANTPNQQYVQLPSICFNIVKPACYDSSSISIEKRLNNNTPNPDNKTLKNNEQFNVFPNPTTGIFTVSCSSQNTTFTVYVSNILTDVLFLKENITSSAQFNLSSKPKGIYFVKVVTTDGKIFTGKIIHN